MPEITQERINQLRLSIHKLRVFMNYSNSMKKKNEADPKLNQKSTKFNEEKIKEADKFKSFDKNNEEKLKPNLSKLRNKSLNINKSKKHEIIDEKIKVLPGECVVNEGEKGNSAFLIISGSFNVEINKKVVGSMTNGDIFGELSLILGENRKATVRAITGSELVEINSSFLDDYLLSSETSQQSTSESRLESQKIIKELSVELGKKNNHKLTIDLEKLESVMETESNIIKSLSKQLYKRLNKMINDEEKNKKAAQMK